MRLGQTIGKSHWFTCTCVKRWFNFGGLVKIQEKGYIIEFLILKVEKWLKLKFRSKKIKIRASFQNSKKAAKNLKWQPFCSFYAIFIFIDFQFFGHISVIHGLISLIKVSKCSENYSLSVQIFCLRWNFGRIYFMT